MQSAEDAPKEKEVKKCVRGSDLFKANHGMRFCKIKEEQLKSILKFVRHQNKVHKGMGSTIKHIRAHLLKEFNEIYHESTIKYAVKHRLNLRYRTVSKRKLVFSAERLDKCRTFCRKLHAARGEELRGDAVIVFQDESCCHQHYTPNRFLSEGN